MVESELDEKLLIETAQTYDKEFRTTWRRPDGSAIPLAVRT